MDYNILATEAQLEKTAAALETKGIKTYIVSNKQEALEQVRALINAGAEVMTGSSVTLEQIGFIDLLKSGNHPWKNLKDAIVKEENKTKQSEMRKQASLAEYFLGSVHGLSEDGQFVVGSNSGSQIPSYSFTSPNVIWVVGAQKIVPDLDSAIKRLREYVVPKEDLRMKSLGFPGTNLSWMLVFNKSIMPRNLHMILVKEELGF